MGADLSRPWFKFQKRLRLTSVIWQNFRFFCYAIFVSWICLTKKARNFVSFHPTEKFLTDLEMAAQNKFFDEVVTDITHLIRRSRPFLSGFSLQNRKFCQTQVILKFKPGSGQVWPEIHHHFQQNFAKKLLKLARLKSCFL